MRRNNIIKNKDRITNNITFTGNVLSIKAMQNVLSVAVKNFANSPSFDLNQKFKIFL